MCTTWSVEIKSRQFSAVDVHCLVCWDQVSWPHGAKWTTTLHALLLCVRCSESEAKQGLCQRDPAVDDAHSAGMKGSCVSDISPTVMKNCFPNATLCSGSLWFSQGRICKKAEVLKSLSLCNKVLSYLILLSAIVSDLICSCFGLLILCVCSIGMFYDDFQVILQFTLSRHSWCWQMLAFREPTLHWASSWFSSLCASSLSSSCGEGQLSE